MGAELSGTNKGNSKTPTGTTAGTSNSNSSTTNSSTGTTGGITTGAAATTGAAEEKKLPKLVTIDVPESLTSEDKKEKRRIKDRERYQKKKESGGSPTSSKPAEIVDANQLNIIILTLTSILASRPNMKQWQLTPDEVKQITTPLSNIIAKSETFANAGEYADQIALMIACATIIIPRIIVTLDNKKKEDQKNVKIPTTIPAGGTTGGNQSKTTESKNAGGGNVREFAPNGKNDGSNLSELLPTYG